MNSRNLNPKVEIAVHRQGRRAGQIVLQITDGLRAVKTGTSLTSGRKGSPFVEAPNVHLPETMVTWEPVSGTLFVLEAFAPSASPGTGLRRPYSRQ
jgi:flavorubredoxin